MTRFPFGLVALVLALAPSAALAADGRVTYQDPEGDDHGPGTYTYPTDTVFRPGSFDLRRVEIERRGTQATVSLTVRAALDDPWRMGSGFAVQMAFVFIDVDGRKGSGHTRTLPGLNVAFAPDDAWDKVIVISPQQPARVRVEVERKAGEVKQDVLVPKHVRGQGNRIVATVDLGDLPGAPADWGIQVVMQSNEGFPAGNDLMTRKVAEFPGQYRFGGGHDGECDPHVVDLIAGRGAGEASEVKEQHKMLAYACAEDGTPKSPATLRMVRAAPGPAKSGK